MLIGIEEIEGKYEVLAKLGEGGMGAIYKVRHVLLDEIQVIKTIRPNLQQDQDLQGRFLREAQVAAKLRHPNIATIHDFSFSKSGEAYIVMSFIEGQNIRDYLRSGGRLSIEQVIEVGKQALDALGYLHSKSFVHRDISTDNMMVTWHEGQPHVTLIDLGLAKSLETQQWHTKTGMVVGKVRYISPEQLNAGVEGVEVDARSDLYSMGVVLYELLTGQFPIVGQDDMSLIAGHLYRPPRSFDETDPHAKIPPAIRAAVMKALEKKAEYRYASAREFAQALDYSLRHGVTAPLPTVIGDQYTVRQVGGPTSGRDPLQPTATVDVFGRPAAVTALAEPARATLPLPSERFTVPIDSEAVTAPITTRLPPPPATMIAAPAAKPLPKLAIIGLVTALALGAVAFALFRPAPEQADKPVKTESPRTPTDISDIFFGDYHALVIGNNNYQQLPKLETAQRDARDIADVLKDRYGFKTTIVLDATRDQLIDAVEIIGEGLTSRDNLLIYYAGHGILQNGTPYWLPVDADPGNTTNWISTAAEITPRLALIETRHILLVADSCYSGAISAENLSNRAAGLNLPRLDEIKELSQFPSRLVLASGGVKPILDSAGGSHSIFAGALLQALRDNQDAIEISKLYEAIKPAIVKSSKLAGLVQEPVLAPIASAGDDGGEMFFVPAKKAG